MPSIASLLCGITSQLYIRRSKYVHSNERHMWAAIDKRFMSEESSDPDDDQVFLVHSIPWHSEGAGLAQSSLQVSLTAQ